MLIIPATRKSSFKGKLNFSALHKAQSHVYSTMHILNAVSNMRSVTVL